VKELRAGSLESIDLGYFSLWLTEHVVPSKQEIEGTKIVVCRDHLDIVYLDASGAISKDRVPLVREKLPPTED
jgi:hypothetical protein